MKPTNNFTAGTKIEAAKVNENFEELWEESYKDLVAGESISVNDSVYVKNADEKVYKTSASHSDERIHGFIGIAKEAGSANDTIRVQVSGVVTGLTLASGSTGKDIYLGNTAGTYSFTSGSNQKRIGTAMSDTSIVLRPAHEHALTNLNQTISGQKTFAQNPLLPEPSFSTHGATKNYVDTTQLSSVASENLKQSLDTERTASAGATNALIKLKEIQIQIGGVIRIKWDWRIEVKDGSSRNEIRRTGQIDPSGDVSGYLYRTDVQGESTYETRTVDIPASAGDRISLWVRNNNRTSYVRNFRVYYDVVAGTGTPVIITD